MKNSEEIVDKYIKEHLDDEFERVQDYSYLDIRSNPSIDACKKEWLSLVNTDKQWTFSNIIKHFHQSICFANNRNSLSPFAGWDKIRHDKALFEKLLRNRLTYNESFIKFGIPDKIPLYIYAQGMGVMRWYKEVTYFKPSLAKRLINTYLSDAKWILDPFSGYSGRMLGALSCGKKYCGGDLCKISVHESNEIYNWLKDNFDNSQPIPPAYIEYADAETTQTDTFDALLTCPPYEDIESWPGVNGNIRTCDEWIDICLKNNKCKDYIFVVDDKIEKYKPYIVETLNNKSHFGTNAEYVIHIRGNS